MIQPRPTDPIGSVGWTERTGGVLSARCGANAQAGGGLRGLCDRVEALGGRVTLTSTTAGTTVQARVPLTAGGIP